MFLTLHEIVSRNTPLEWFESVALVQAACATAARDHAEGLAPRIPDLAGILVSSDGTVALEDPGEQRESPMFRAGTVLNALLPAGRTPAPLQLVALGAISPKPQYASLADLSRALDYFERPDRQGVVSAVYHRAQQLPPASVQPLAAYAAGSAAARVAVDAAPWPWLRAAAWTAAGLVLVTSLAAAVWFVMWTPPPGTKKTFTGAVVSAVEAVQRQLGSNPPAPIEPTPLPNPAAAGRATAKADTKTRRRPTVEQAPRGPETDDVVYAEQAPGAQFDPVYSAADADVRPPVAIRPNLPSAPPPGVRRDELTRVEVVITAAGEVESVRLLGGPRQVLDSMMLSAVKTWKFRPAMRNGNPVAYRHIVWLTSF
jgi:TonB family protein